MGERWYREQLKPKSDKKTTNNENFGAVGDGLRANGFVPIPLTGKRPIPNGWADFWLNPPSDKTYATWRKKNADANVGICLGEVIAIDIDIDDQVGAEHAQSLIFSLLGSTPFIRVGRAPRRTLFYRLRYEEARQTSSWKVDRVEILADGKQSAVFGIHPDTGNPFTWPQRSILGALASELPLITMGKLRILKARLVGQTADEEEERSIFTENYLPQIGERNNYLHWYAREIAGSCATQKNLVEQLQAKNLRIPESLPLAEVEQISRSVWRYKKQGTLLRSGRNAPIALPVTREIGAERFRRLAPGTAKLFLVLIATRDSRQEFTIPQKATAEYLGCGVDTVSKSIKELIAVGLLVDDGHKRGGSSNRRAAKLYRFGSGTATGACLISSILL